MKAIAGLTAVTLMLAITAAVPRLAFAKDNSNSNAVIQQVVLNNFNTTQQQLASQISAHLTAGRISAGQAAAFNAQLTQIASQSAASSTNAAMTQQLLSQFNALSNQINASLAADGTYSATTVSPLNTTGTINKWNSHHSNHSANQNGRFGRDYNYRNQERFKAEQQAHNLALQTFDQRLADQQQRFTQMTNDENTRYQKELQRLNETHRQLLADITNRQTAKQQAATLERQKLVDDYTQRIRIYQH
jgi:hypothetical protein